MAAVAVAADNDRVAEAAQSIDAGTWGNDGGGGGVADEPDFVYQGTIAQSRKVSTSRIGRSYSGGTTRDATTGSGTYQTFLFKINITNFAGLLARTAPAAGIKIGSSSTAYDEWYVFGNDNYPTAGGWQFVAINPNVTGYIDDNTNGTPDFTNIDYYSLIADFSATSKGENVVIDAIDLGTGLVLTGGDGADPDGLWTDFLSADEGTVNNRWGYTRSLSGIYYVQGRLAIGENAGGTAVATVFQDTSGQVIVWENGRAATGYYGMRFNLGNATTDIDITGTTFDSVGEKDNTLGGLYTTTEDTRLDVVVTGTLGTLGLTGCFFRNLSSMTLTSACTLDTTDVEVETLDDGGGAEIFDSVIRTTSVSGVATITNPTFGSTTDIRNTEFVQAGAGHAIEFTSAGTYDLTGIGFTGYNASDNQNDSAIYCSAGSGTITVNVTNGDTPSVRAPGMTIDVVNAVNVTLEDLVIGSEVYIFETNTPANVVMALTADTATETVSYAYVSDTDITIRVRKSSAAPKYLPYTATGSITSNGFVLSVNQVLDTIAE